MTKSAQKYLDVLLGILDNESPDESLGGARRRNPKPPSAASMALQIPKPPEESVVNARAKTPMKQQIKKEAVQF